MELLRTLIVVSEKAANVARVCRRDDRLFELLVEKKGTREANPRFVEDFKTLADVLIQEMVRHDVGKQFPELTSAIKGEESNTFRNKLNETICVEVKQNEEETSRLLETILNGNKIAAGLLAQEVHREIKIEEVNTTIPEEIDVEIDLRELGVWIDPIDCTTEYIHGSTGNQESDIHLNGLQCVTILIGAFDKTTGYPVMGIINRPFLDSTTQHNCIWGLSSGNIRLNSGFERGERTKIVCISSSEDEGVKEKLNEAGFNLVPAAGAGYKILTVILGLADAYIITKGTTFKWDTCAPHAILKTLNGDIVSFTPTTNPIVYSVDGDKCNFDGIIAYRDEEIIGKLRNVLSLE